ncbi:sugar ABC transporter ATP-binding protein [Frigidibacter sp. ROC022]|uniref:sugar ABC transporter ATP-binding protein n=1 Tax=Frigidibacter sp. ROC022 TaxID=2971796 RepID=UPI00215A3529|nr:sugar ABC transporter ATP-binding protein [Frigidibacter sp. ROC022]MCR8725393.1 sugar ABC transporter ATP-binding protein [Frigidibacter sp. ROC022]
MTGMTKVFPGVRALSNVDLTCHAGEVHVLAGENGAGKSTLIKILSGVYRPDAGKIVVNGQEAVFRHPLEALRAGISVIYQEFSLLPDRTVAQNIFLGREIHRRGRLDHAAMNASARQTLETLGVHGQIAPEALVSDLDVASQQMVEIAKALSLDPQVLVMDEPTAALNPTECAVLFEAVDRLRARGCAIIYITHRMHEVQRLADRVSVLKDGELSAHFDSLPEPSAIVRAMVGRDIDTFFAPRATSDQIGDVLLEVRDGGNARLDAINFTLRRGEVLGFAGIQGAGRAALGMALFGDTPLERGQVILRGQPVRITSTRDAIAAGIGLLPGDRKAEALALEQSVLDNGMLSARALARLLGSHRSNGFTNTGRMSGLLDKMEVRAPDYEVAIGSLSGGNQQKAIVARWLALAPEVLIFIEPTRGIDVNAKAGIYQLMRDLAIGGAGIILISSDLPEVLGCSDRIVVMRDGTVAGEFGPSPSETEVMELATSARHAAA